MRTRTAGSGALAAASAIGGAAIVQLVAQSICEAGQESSQPGQGSAAVMVGHGSAAAVGALSFVPALPAAMATRPVSPPPTSARLTIRHIKVRHTAMPA